MAIKVGDRIPETTLKTPTSKGPADITTNEIFKGKKVVLFAVPGAFTPLCSAQHLPGYIENADAIKAKGIDTIACLAVNDGFVMGAWGEAQGAGDKVQMLADGSGTFTKALGLELDASGFGMGTRAQRFAAVIDDGVVTVLNVEKPMAFDVSGADVILDAL
jgi:peroxiredoxin